MIITFITDVGDTALLELGADTTLDFVKSCVEAQLGIPVMSQVLMHNGKDLSSPGLTTLSSMGVLDNDLIMVALRAEPQAATSTAAAAVAPVVPSLSQPEVKASLDIMPRDPLKMIMFFDENPTLLRQLNHLNEELAEAVKSKDPNKLRTTIMMQQMNQHKMKWEEEVTITKLEANPFDEESQKKIEKIIYQRSIENNLRQAMDETPEVFGRVIMLYIDAVVNKEHIKAFVDSGAESTIMSVACAKRCRLDHLIDTRYSGIAKGVGTGKIVGRIHSSDICVNGAYLTCSFTVLEANTMDFLFGLDMLRRHQCVIDLPGNVLRLTGAGISAPFLSEKDLPESARGTWVEAGSAVKEAGAAALNTTADEEKGNGSTEVPPGVEQLVAMGFDKRQAQAALHNTNGNVDEAASILFEQRRSS